MYGEMTREEWLEWRQRGLGASDVPIACGLSPWSSPTRLWAQKRGEAAGLEENDRMEFGSRAEAVVADMAAARWGWTLEESEGVTHPQWDWARCTPDRFRVDVEPRELVEIKVCWSSQHWRGSGPAVPHTDPGGNVPAYYYVQVQWQLFVCGLDSGWLVAMVAGELRRYRVKRCDQTVRAIFGKASKFWKQVQDGTQPDDPSEDAASVMAERGAGTEDAEADVEPDLAAEYVAADEALKEAKERRSWLRNRIVRALGNAQRGRCDGWIVRASHRDGGTYLDQRALREEHPELCSAYERPRKGSVSLTVKPIEEKEE